jgi:hypothetical protein
MKLFLQHVILDETIENISNYLLSFRKTHNLVIDLDWDQLEHIIFLLKLLDDMTNYLSKSRFPSVLLSLNM